MRGLRAALISAAVAVTVLLSMSGAPAGLDAGSVVGASPGLSSAGKTKAAHPKGAAPTQVPKTSAPGKVNCRKVKCVALTFDDGPVRQTNHLIDVLASRGARATFFVVGRQAKNRLKILRRMVAHGNAIGNHSWDHPMFSRLSSAKIASQLKRTDAVITAAVGAHPLLVRTPFGQQDKRLRKAVGAFGAPVILWSVDPQDWKIRNTAKVINRVVSKTRRNSIVLMHDIRPTTRAAVASIVDRLQAQGYVLVTIPELLGSRASAGKVFTRG